VSRGSITAGLAAGLGLLMSGAVRADFQSGLDAHARGDFALAHAEWLPLAQAGDASAQANLGVMYLRGQGASTDKAKATRWLQLAANQGNAIAQDNLGQMYYLGKGIPKDLDAAAHWIKAAAYGDNPSAQLRLGILYAEGIGVERDPDRALLWWKKSAAQGNAAARARIAVAGGADHVSEHFVPRPSAPAAPAPMPSLRAVASPPSPTPPVSAPAPAHFLVQIASVGTLEDAEDEWGRLQRRNRDLLGDLALDVQQAKVGTRVVYRLRAGPLRDHASAEKLCRALQNRRLDCLIREAP
jgi:hypothetical protein